MIMEERKTQKQIADMIGINEKTLREYLALAYNFEALKANIGEELSSKFEKVFDNVSQNKKKKISNDAISKMVTLPIELQKELVLKVIENPENSKDIVSEYINSISEIKVTVTLPNDVNEHYKKKAEAVNKSKTEYIEMLLRLIAKSDDEE
jgi:tRNA nucleotidyltransferase/poly(A) polymerase